MFIKMIYNIILPEMLFRLHLWHPNVSCKAFDALIQSNHHIYQLTIKFIKAVERVVTFSA